MKTMKTKIHSIPTPSTLPVQVCSLSLDLPSLFRHISVQFMSFVMLHRENLVMVVLHQPPLLSPYRLLILEMKIIVTFARDTDLIH